MTDEIQARFEDIERRLAALEAAEREPAAKPVGILPEWLKPLDAMFKSGNPAHALTEAERLREGAYAASSTDRLEELRDYLSVGVQYPRVERLLRVIDENLGRVPRWHERRTDLRPFPASKAVPPAIDSVPAPGDDAGETGED